MFQWLTTKANPRSAYIGHDAGQRGWKLHAVRCTPDEKFSDIKYIRAKCGLIPSYGWSIDMFVTDHCKRCTQAIESTLKRNIKRGI